MAYEHLYEMSFSFKGKEIHFPFSVLSESVEDASDLTKKHLAIAVFQKVQSTKTRQLLSEATGGESDTPNYGYREEDLTSDILISGLQAAINSYLKGGTIDVEFTHLFTSIV